MAAICFAARYSPGRGCRRCWRCWSRARQRITPRARRRGSCRENGYHRSKNDDTSRVIAALSLCLVWLSTAVRPGAGQLLQCGDLSSAAHVDPDRGRRADNPQHPGLFMPAVPPADRLAGQYPAAQFPLAGPSRPLLSGAHRVELSADRAGHRPAVYPRRSFAGAGPAAGGRPGAALVPADTGAD